MSRAGYRPRAGADEGWRIAASPHAPALLGGLLALAAVSEVSVRAVVMGTAGQPALVLCLLALATTVPLALLRPTGAALACFTACLLTLGFFYTLTVAGLIAQLLSAYQYGRSISPRFGPPVAAAALAGPYVLMALTNPVPRASEAGVIAVLLAALAPTAAMAGFARSARSEMQMHRAARQVIAGTLLEHTARGERARIARELHDVVAHHISMVAVQAETARLTTPGMPADGAKRLFAIGETARAALTEMRRLLGVLREDAQTDAAELRPQPGLNQLNDLLDAARDASGTSTRLILRGAPVPLDPVVELAAYRIVQEALTNARRHAPGAAVDVELHYTEDALLLRIRDNGPGASTEALVGGHGLPGMRERAAVVGGKLLSGPAPGGGFLVEATLPAKVEAPA